MTTKARWRRYLPKLIVEPKDWDRGFGFVVLWGFAAAMIWKWEIRLEWK